MPDEGMEQTAEAPPEQTTVAVLEQTEEAAPEVVESAAPEGEGAAPEPRVTFSDDAELRAFLESDERAKSYLEKAKADAFNAARQKVEADQRKQMASDEVLTDAAKRLALELGVEADDARVRQYAQAFTRPFIDRNQIEINRLYIEGAKSSFTPDAQAAIDMAVEQAGDDGEALASIVTQLWQYRDSSSRADALNSTSLEDIPEGSKLRKDIDAYVTKQLEAELKARDIAANRQGAEPRTTTGAAPGANRDQEINNILQTVPATDPRYREAYREKYGFELAVR